MKKLISISIVCVIVSLIAGCQLGYMGACKKYSKSYNLLKRKSELADSIMSRNDVYDMDGGDQMAEYLFVSETLDTLLAK